MGVDFYFNPPASENDRYDREDRTHLRDTLLSLIYGSGVLTGINMRRKSPEITQAIELLSAAQLVLERERDKHGWK